MRIRIAVRIVTGLAAALLVSTLVAAIPPVAQARA
ncbi:MAG: hypothetical protein QOK10_2500, partial [Pseudonocardiales bacterium]|nr:hypothetical protein [Pseudonocardiales bacterium]